MKLKKNILWSSLKKAQGQDTGAVLRKKREHMNSGTGTTESFCWKMSKIVLGLAASNGQLINTYSKKIYFLFQDKFAALAADIIKHIITMC